MELLDIRNFNINDEVFLKDKENYSQTIQELQLKEPYQIINIYNSKDELEIYDENMNGMPLFELIDKFNRAVPFFVYEYEVES